MEMSSMHMISAPGGSIFEGEITSSSAGWIVTEIAGGA